MRCENPKKDGRSKTSFTASTEKPSPKMNKPLIQLFLKAPREGLVKTRLAASIGNENALTVYHNLVVGQLSRLPHDWPVRIHFTPADAEEEFSGWLGNHHTFAAQCEGNLGERLGYAVDQAFRQGHQRVICIGADCPELDEIHFKEAQAALEQADVVYGPTLDGGYYLIGMKASHKALFQKIPWSTSETLSCSLQAARNAGLSTHLLSELRDIDTVSDLALAAEQGLLAYHSPIPAPTPSKPRS